LLLITGCTGVIESNLQYTPIEKINNQLDLFIKNYEKDIYLIQQSNQGLNSFYSIEIISNPDGSARGITVVPISTFEIIDYTRGQTKSSRVSYIIFVYIPLIDEYYVVDSSFKKILDLNGKFVDAKDFLYEKAQPLL
jgi:hypothetical protein